MVQKAALFKGQKTKKNIPANRHGKLPHTRKGKRAVKSTKMGTDEMDKEVTKFINQCNEMTAATKACKDGGMLCILKPGQESSGKAKK